MKLMKTIKTFSYLSLLPTFEERFEYLKLTGRVGAEVFGVDRQFNQMFYRSNEWKRIKNHVIVRDKGFDLGVEGWEIPDRILVHHMNPITLKDLEMNSVNLLDPEFLISTSVSTHLAIHYGDSNLLPRLPFVRKPNDTKQW